MEGVGVSFISATATIDSRGRQSCHRTPSQPAGALLLGDAFNMRHPLTGGGMTVALSDTRLLCEMLQPLPSFQDALMTAERTADFYTARKPLSATVNTLANALYQVCGAVRSLVRSNVKLSCHCACSMHSPRSCTTTATSADSMGSCHFVCVSRVHSHCGEA